MVDAMEKDAVSQTSAGSSHRTLNGLVPWLILGYVILVLVGYAFLRRPGVMASGQEINPERAFFLASNAATLTGFQQSVGINEFDPDTIAGPLIIISLTVLGSLLALVVGGLAAVRALR